MDRVKGYLAWTVVKLSLSGIFHLSRNEFPSSPHFYYSPWSAGVFSALSGEHIDASRHLSVLFPHHTDGGMDSNKVFKTDTVTHRYFGYYSPTNVGDFSGSHALYFINSVNSHRVRYCWLFYIIGLFAKNSELLCCCSVTWPEKNGRMAFWIAN